MTICQIYISRWHQESDSALFGLSPGVPFPRLLWVEFCSYSKKCSVQPHGIIPDFGCTSSGMTSSNSIGICIHVIGVSAVIDRTSHSPCIHPKNIALMECLFPRTNTNSLIAEPPHHKISRLKGNFDDFKQNHPEMSAAQEIHGSAMIPEGLCQSRWSPVFVEASRWIQRQAKMFPQNRSWRTSAYRIVREVPRYRIL